MRVHEMSDQSARFSVYLLYQYKSTQFTCFTSTQVQILTPEELRGGGSGAGAGWVLEFDGPNHFFVCKAAKGATITKRRHLKHASYTPLTRLLHASYTSFILHLQVRLSLSADT